MGRVTRTNFGWTVTRRLTNAEILTLFSVPIILIPARVNTIFWPMAMQIISETTAAAYATVASLTLGVTGALTLWNTISLADSQLDSGALSAYIPTFQNGQSSLLSLASDAANLPLVLSANADPTGGDPANYAIVTVEGLTFETV
jgi:hypothetical protein